MARASPALLLVTVALTQIGLSNWSVLSPWKGGGFGMFSSLDHQPFRGINIIVERSTHAFEFDSTSLGSLYEQAVAFPSELFLAKLARAVIAREDPSGFPVTVTLIVWRRSFDSSTLAGTDHVITVYRASSN